MVGSTARQWLTLSSDDDHPRTFQSILYALDHPGGAVRLDGFCNPPPPLNGASAAAMLTLLNPETPVWTDVGWDSPPAVWLQRFCGFSLVTETCMARWAIITDPATMPPLRHFYIGENENPEAAATLILQVPGFTPAHDGFTTTHGTRRTSRLAPIGLHRGFWDEWESQRDVHPLGVDVFFTCEDLLIALPCAISRNGR